MDFSATSSQYCGPEAFLCKPFCEFSFFLQANRQDKLLQQQMTYINVNEYLMCTSFSCKRWSKVGEFWQASFQGAQWANLSPGARAQPWKWQLQMQLASWLYLPLSHTPFNLCFSCLSNEQDCFSPHETNITLSGLFLQCVTATAASANSHLPLHHPPAWMPRR